MKPEVVHRLHRHFEDYVHDAGGVEFWYARDLQVLLGYKEWRNFSKVLEKARESCQNAKHNISDHFVDVNKMVPLGSGSEREIADIMLTRYACYFIAQNGDPRKEEIAFAQPPEEDLKKLERRVRSQEKRLADSTGRLSGNTEGQEGED